MSIQSIIHRIRTTDSLAYGLCTFAILCWSGNFVVGRLAHRDIPPVALSFWRHVLAALIVAPLARPYICTDWPELRRKWLEIALLSGLFVTGNTLVYFVVNLTTVINAALINAGQPVVTVLFSWLILCDVVRTRQSLGILLSMIGILVILTRADPEVLLALDYRWGDLLMFLAIVAWGLYMVLFKYHGLALSPLSMLCALMVGGSLWLAPFYFVEMSWGAVVRATPLSLASLGYVTLFSTLIAWACWNSGIQRIGPNRAASFVYLFPVFGPILAMAFLGESLRFFHFIGTAMIILGVSLVVRPTPGR